ncbi:MAG: sodium:proton antiporter, partial [Verrucomicrobia bacterium]|nr:sodium:proton antiporter [Verrucomicrobiota bacterium]
MVLPFVLLLLSLAVCPAFAPKWWARHYAKSALGLGAVTLVYELVALRNFAGVERVACEYVSFIVLTVALFVVSGGIHIVVKGRATAATNTAFLLVGAVLANVLGTTGAALLLIRPWLRVNRDRARGYHVAFFIFLVANIGGCLTPIGDPPLFLGYLQGVPFWWVAVHCWPIWATAMGLLLAVFYILDRRHDPHAATATAGDERWTFKGLWNLFFLAVVVAAVFVQKPLFLREAVMAAAALSSFFLTRRYFQHVHQKNEFDFHPALEMGVLFA